MTLPSTPSTISLPRRLQLTLAVAVLIALVWAALAPLRYPTRELDLVLAQRTRVPAQLRLTLGVRDVLLLRNRDAAPHVFGPLRVLPGHELRLPFEQAGAFPFACDLAPQAQVLVQVLAQPDPGWQRLRWRLATWFEALRTLPLQGPDD